MTLTTDAFLICANLNSIIQLQIHPGIESSFQPTNAIRLHLFFELWRTTIIPWSKFSFAHSPLYTVPLTSLRTFFDSLDRNVCDPQPYNIHSIKIDRETKTLLFLLLTVCVMWVNCLCVFSGFARVRFCSFFSHLDKAKNKRGGDTSAFFQNCLCLYSYLS